MREVKGQSRLTGPHWPGPRRCTEWRKEALLATIMCHLLGEQKQTKLKPEGLTQNPDQQGMTPTRAFQHGVHADGTPGFLQIKHPDIPGLASSAIATH
jgi:hypothetical protein